jgi:hypothetical protein
MLVQVEEMGTKKEEVDIIDAEVLEDLHNPDLEFKEPSRKKPRGKRKKDFPAFTHTARTLILSATMKGVPPDVAAKAAGVLPDTLYNWLQRGALVSELLESGDEDRIEDIAPVELDFSAFYTDFNKAAAFGEVRLIEIINTACEDDPKLAMRWLEKVNPERFGPKIQQQISMTGQVAHAHLHGSVGKLPEGQGLAKRLPTKDLKTLRANILKDKQKLLEAGEIQEDDET